MLTTKKRLFIDYVIQGNNQTKSAVLAGYKKESAHTTGYRLVRNAEIKNEIEIILKKRAEELNLNPKNIMNRLNTEANNATKPSDRIRALEILSKILGMYQEGSQNVTILSDEKYKGYLRRLHPSTRLTSNTKEFTKRESSTEAGAEPTPEGGSNSAINPLAKSLQLSDSVRNSESEKVSSPTSNEVENSSSPTSNEINKIEESVLPTEIGSSDEKKDASKQP